ncbi:MAG: PmoA family protein [Phycisphaerales bacterium]|nr:MAG: PmoA family protein [Phycisphaerales bacterium]
MNRWRLIAGALLTVTCGCSLVPAAPQKVTAKLEKGQIAVTMDGALFTCYKFASSQKYPYFWPVVGPLSGKSITTETSEPYPHHHSLFFGCDRVNGGNYWQDVNARGQILSQGPKLIEASGERIVLTDTCLWKQPDKNPVIEDKRKITVSAPSETLRIIDFQITLTPLVDIEILQTNHSLFSARVVPELSVKSGGTLVNAQGDKSEKGTFGAASPWCDYSGTRDSVTEGIAIMQNPKNRWYPSKWFTRDYGFFSPTPMYWLEGDKLNLAKGEELSLEYRVVVHAGNAKAADIAGLFNRYSPSAR